MIILFTACVGLSVLGSSFFKIRLGPLSVINIYMLWTMLYYLNALVAAVRHRLRIKKETGYLFLFVCYAFIVVLLSYTGILSANFLDQVYVDYSYIPRQAYYLLFLPLPVIAALLWKPNKIANFVLTKPERTAFLLYAAYCIYNQRIALAIPITLFLGACLLLVKSRTVSTYILLFIVLFSPIGAGGEMTQLILRFLVAVYFIFPNKSLKINKIVWFGIVIVIAGSIISGPILTRVVDGLDPNSLWRLQYWADEMTLLAKSYGVGLGYGTSYASFDFLAYSGFGLEGGPFGANSEYSGLEQAFVTGSHNSMVSITYRLGFIGLGLLMLFLSRCNRMLADARESLFVNLLFYGSIVICIFNVGFESPHYLFPFLMAVGLVCSLETIETYSTTEL